MKIVGEKFTVDVGIWIPTTTLHQPDVGLGFCFFSDSNGKILGIVEFKSNDKNLVPKIQNSCYLLTKMEYDQTVSRQK